MYTGLTSQDELRGLIEIFMLTQPELAPIAETLQWLITDYCDVVCGAGLLVRENSYNCIEHGSHWDIKVSARSPIDFRHHDLTLSCRGHQIALLYRLDGRIPIVIASPEFLDNERCYRIKLPQLHREEILNRSRAKAVLANPVYTAMFPK